MDHREGTHLTGEHDSRGRLLLLVTSRQRRGAEVFGEQLAGGLTERGWQVDLAALVDADPPTIRATALAPRHRAELGPLDRDVIAGIRRRIADTRPDVVFANGSATLRYAVAARALRRKPRLVYGSIGEPSWWAASRSGRLRTRLLLSRTDLVTSVSAATGRQLTADLRVPAAKVAVTPIGVPAEFGRIEPDPPAGEMRVLFIGSLSPEKGPETALRAVARSPAARSMRLRMVGAGPLLERLEAQVAELGVADRVELVGPVPDVAPHLAWADLLVLSSQTEGLPGVLLEAGAAGVPAVAFDVGGVTEIVEDEVTGWLVARGDEAALAAALTRAAEQPSARRAMGEAVRARVLGGYTLDRAIDRYDQVLQAVLAGRIPAGMGA